MCVIHFLVPGPPVAWKRPGKGRRGHSYEEPAVTSAKAAIVLYARGAAASRTFPTGPVNLAVTAVHPRPTERPDWCSRDVWATGARVPAVTRADLSNVVKLVEDALGVKQRTGGWRLWNDDNQVAHINAGSWYAAEGEEPHVDVTVCEATP